MRLLFLFMISLVSHSSASTTSSSQGMKASPKEVPFIDLSYRTHLDTSNLQSILSKGIHGVKSIREVSSADSKDQDSDATISIDRFNMDVSASRLGDAGILSLLDSLVEYEERNVSSDLVISLEARMNHISIVGASNLFERISGWKSVQTHFLEGDEKSDQMDSPDKNVVGLESFGNEIENGDENDKEETNMDAKDQGEESDVSSVSRIQRNVYIEALDIGLNDIGHCHIITAHKKAATAMSQLNKSLRTLIENESGSCPRVLRMDVCGFGAPSCRAIGKGLIHRQNHITSRKQPHRTLRKLYLSGNSDISDGGAAALAAALKLSSPKMESTMNSTPETKQDDESLEPDSVLDILELSSCGIGDAGAKAFAIAIESNPGCVMNLDLSNNEITDEGAIELSRGLIAGLKQMKSQPKSKSRKPYIMNSINLSNNEDIGDDGAEALFDAVKCGALRCLALRSCSIKWRGAAALGTALGSIISREEGAFKELQAEGEIEIDLSGNHLGKKKRKKKKDLTSAVSENMMNGMNFIGKRLKSGLKDVGLNGLVGSSLESDDEAELMDAMGSKLAEEQSSSLRCGACEMYGNLSQELNTIDSGKDADSPFRVILNLRMCNFDDEGMNALGALCALVGDDTTVCLCIDCSMNSGVLDDEEVLSALARGEHMHQDVQDLVERHNVLIDRFGYDEYDARDYDDYDIDGYYP